MPTTIEFSAASYEEILAHAREGSPREVCGVLGGERPDDRDTERTSDGPDARPVTRVRSAHRAENVARSPRRTYLIDPETQLEIMERIEERGGDVVGFYHSHPTGPSRPSPVDKSRATWVGHSYVICLPDVPFVGSWRWSGEQFTPEIVSLR